MNKKQIIILIIVIAVIVISAHGYVLILSGKEKKEFIDACKAEQATARYITAPVPCEEQWSKKQQGL